MKKVYLLLLLCIAGIAGHSQTLITYSQAFTNGVAPTTQCTAWDAYRASLPAANVYSFTIFGSNDPIGKTCTDPFMAQSVANALRTGTTFGPVFDITSGQTWLVFIGGCTASNCSGNPSVEFTGTGAGCNCGTGYTLRPNINNLNWGGINTLVCGGPTQTMSLTFSVYSYDNGSPQSLTMCQDAPATLIDNLLKVSGGNGTDTWTVTGLPLHGTLAGFPTTASAGVSSLPAGASYTPTTGYSGTDAFTIQATDGVNTVTTTINVTINPLPVMTFGPMPEVCAGTTSANLTFGAVTDAISKTTTINYTGAVVPWTVPDGVTSITIDAQGAAGGLNSQEGTFVDRQGYGARVQTTLAVTPGQVLNIYVGGVGNDGGAGAGGAGGFNGGGMGGFAFANFSGGGGGGATDIRIGGVALSDRVLVAAGGGGAGLECGSDFDRGGDGGGLTGEDGGGACSAGNGFGGTPSTAGGGGSCGGCSGNPGMGGTAATGGDGGLFTSGGGGGGGLWGGGGAQWDGGAGGSSYTDPILATSVVHTRGFNTGAGVVTISYAIPTTYNIAWDPASTTAGFVDVTAASVTSSPINLVVPGAAPAATYTGTLTINNSTTTCSSVGYPISVTVKPIPDVAPIGSQIICDSTFTSAILFSGSVPGTSFDWTNSDASILLAATGSGDISSFIADDSSLSVPVTAVFTVTPSRLGCVGAVQTFSITVKPNPNVWPSSNQTICNNTLTAPINFSGHVAGTVYTWNNTNSSIGLPATGAGDIAAFLGIDTSTSPLSSTITVNTTANGCTGSSNSFTITIDPTPIFTSSLNPPAICNNTMFNYTPTSATPTTTFDWSRAVVSGISNPAATGSGDPAETLTNTTPNPITVVYVYTLTANTCTNVQSINVIVYPTPMLSSSLTPPAVCDSTLFTYIHTSATTGTAFAWSRGVVAGISNPASSGVDTIRETLVNTTPNPIMVTYVDTLTANGCKNIQTINLTVNPRPMLSSATTLSPICDGAHVLYIATSLTTGTSFTWSRGVIAGISNPADNGGDTISENLNNNSDNPVTVTYVDTLKANGCINTQNVTILVYPTPKLSSSLTPYAPLGLCDSSLFNYTPMSNTVGSGFTWTRDFIMGIGLPAGSGSGNPNEILYNNTNYNISVVYVYTISANGCTNTQNVAVVIHPVPTMASTLSMTTCSGVNFHYVPTGYVTGSTFVWNRSAATGIKPTSGAGAGTIDEVLTDTALVPLPTSYKFTLSANGCSHIQYLMVTVNPTPPMLSISTHSPGSLCSNTLYQNFGTDALPPAGQHYSWSATNATVWATGTGGQYSLISFKNPGHAVVSLNSNITGFSCIQNNTFDVTVGTGVSGNPQVVFHAGQLICLKADEDSYQWGFDDAHTLDSTIITGENNPNYFISGADFVNRYYWVITRNGDCMQKSYYNVPLGITNVNNETADIKVYPNPASDMVNVVINTSLDGKYEIAVMNLLGQVVRTETAADHKASMDVNSLPAGTYLVVCTRDGVKIGAQKFIKN